MDRMAITQAERAQRKRTVELRQEEEARLQALLAAAAPRLAVPQEATASCGRPVPQCPKFERPGDGATKPPATPLARFLGGDDHADGPPRETTGAAEPSLGSSPTFHLKCCGDLTDQLIAVAVDEAGTDREGLVATLRALVKALLLEIELATGACCRAERERLRLFAKVFESDLEAVIISSPAGEILHANRMTRSISGYAPAELVGRSVALLLTSTQADSFEALWQRLVSEGSWRGDIWHRHANGSEYLARTSIAAVRGDDGRATHYVIEYSDATDAHMAENALRHRTEELARSNRELEQFAYIASHDLQEPLRMVAGYTQLLARRYRGQLDEDADTFIAFAADGATRMQALISDLLKLSRVGTHGQPFQRVRTDEVLDIALENLSLSLSETSTELNRGPLPEVTGDRTQLVQLFQNLLANAVKFHAPGQPARIRVDARRIDGAWEFAVADEGIGIAAADFERIFVIFQRLHGPAEYPGTGIGLALCKRIVERHGGRIRVTSAPGTGATFFFTIPEGVEGER